MQSFFKNHPKDKQYQGNYNQKDILWDNQLFLIVAVIAATAMIMIFTHLLSCFPSSVILFRKC